MKLNLARFLLLAGIGCALVRSEAQTFVIDWFTIDGGGGTSSGGPYTLSGTIGQPDAGALTGGAYTLEGGFWPGLVVPSTEAPTLYILAAGDHVVISWSPVTPGFELQHTENLDSPSWSSAPGGQPVSIPITTSTRFYRLQKP